MQKRRREKNGEENGITLMTPGIRQTYNLEEISDVSS